VKLIQPARAAALLLMAALAACSDAPTGAAITAPDQSALFNTAPTVTVTNSGGTPLISWGALAGATSYSVGYSAHYTVLFNGKVYGSVSNYPLGSTSGTSWLDTTNSYTGVTQCISEFPGETERMEYRYVVTATFANGTSTTRVAAPIAHCPVE